jgi:hypothetical protein
MKAFFRYRSDNGEEWIVLREDNIEEPQEHTISPSGFEAVTVRKELPIDQCLITFRPATRITDDIKNQISFKDRYYLIITNLWENEELVSKEMYTWNDVIALGSLFRSATFDKAKKIWRMKKL